MRTRMGQLLPATLLTLIQTLLVSSQPPPPPTALTLNTVFSLNASSITSTWPIPRSLALDSNSNSLSINIALCSPDNANSPPRFFVSNSSTITSPGSTNVNGNTVVEIKVQDGFGEYDGYFSDGGFLRVEMPQGQAQGSIPIQVALSDNGPMLGPLDDTPEFLPLLGDTTSNQALLFSPPFSPSNTAKPSFPNYTLPSAQNASTEEPPESHTNYTIFIAATSPNAATAKRPTACMLPNQRFAGRVVDEQLWLRSENTDDGWRSQWLIGGLTPSTNYTAWVIKDGTRASGPTYFVTKSASFPCPLVANLPYCPGISYAVPITPPPAPFSIHDTSTLPSSITDPLLSSLTNFSTTLSTQACGRDFYSPLVDCKDCEQAYRTWLCTMWFTRCTEKRPGDDQSRAVDLADAGSMVPAMTDPKTGAQVVLSALVAQPSYASSSASASSSKATQQASSRNSRLPPFEVAYTMLQPCLETCTFVDRTCPSFLGFRCPLKRFNGGMSYAIGYEDSGEENGGQGEGVVGPGGAQDRWGNVWCNRGI